MGANGVEDMLKGGWWRKTYSTSRLAREVLGGDEAGSGKENSSSLHFDPRVWCTSKRAIDDTAFQMRFLILDDV